jgi:hypothetical protein
MYTEIFNAGKNAELFVQIFSQKYQKSSKENITFGGNDLKCARLLGENLGKAFFFSLIKALINLKENYTLRFKKFEITSIFCNLFR